MIKGKLFVEKCIMISKLFLAFIWIKAFGKKLTDRNIWLISEKTSEARDNGYHLFKFLREKHPEVYAYYVITKESADLYKIEKLGNIIKANTIKHCIYYLCSLYSISSQPAGACPEPKSVIRRFAKIQRKDQNVVFLQHGVTKDELPHSFDYNKTHFSLFVCSSILERDFVEKTYNYPPGIVKNLGLCRFDNLFNNHNVKKQVLIMPTFRQWLKSDNMPKEAFEREKDQFVKSDYFCAYARILKNIDLINYLRHKGYKIVFYPHYAMQPYIHCFDEYSSDVVTIADRWHYDVQTLLIESACLITDFSSVFFDYAYMEKPEIFYQFDEERYRSTHYKKGYFDYKRDGFGPVFETSEQVVNYLMEIISKGCKLEDKYKKRVEAFFDRRDNHNCERTFEAIIQIGKE